jgi:tetratricopeptide (TPR) repeat protein
VNKTPFLQLAIYFLEKALAIDLRLFGEQGSSAATCYNNLGLAWQTKGNLNEAVENFEKSLSIHLRLFGEENPKTKQIYQNAGWGIIEKGDKQKGLAYLRKTCFVGFSLYEEAQFFNLKGASKFMANQYGSAVNDYQTALYLLEQSKTEKTHTLWATLYQNMAKAYCQSGSKKKALHLFRKALLFAKSVKKGEIEIEKIEKNYADCKNK